MLLSKKTKPVFFLFLTFFCFSQTVFSQQLLYKFKQFTTNEGLPSSEVHKVLSDSRNFLWFATDHGVCRYDGYKFETFNLPDNSILSMFEDEKKRIWVVTFSGRLYYFENGYFEAYRYNERVLAEIKQFVIIGLYVDSSDNVYINTTEPGSILLDSKGIVTTFQREGRHIFFKTLETERGDFITYIDPRGWSGRLKDDLADTGAELHVLVKTSGREYMAKSRFFGDNGIKVGTLKVSDGSIIFYFGPYIFRILLDGSYTVKNIGFLVLDIKEVEKGKLFIATRLDGLYVMNEKYEIIEHYFPQQTVTSIAKDYEGGIWVSTTSNGAFYLNSLRLKHLSKGATVMDNNVVSLGITRNGGIWAGGNDNNILYFEPGKKLEILNLPFVTVNNIQADLLSDTVVFSIGVIANYIPERILFTASRGITIAAIQAMSHVISYKGEFFTGKTIGIGKIDFAKGWVELLNKDRFRASKLFLDYHGNMLVGNLFGLWRFKDKKLEPYDSTRGLLKTRITDIHEFKDSFLCLGTRGKGFLMFINDSLYQLTTLNGLSSDNIRRIFIDENTIWLATNQGISRLSVQSLDPFRYSILNISAKDGLPSNEVNDIRRLGNDMIVATKNGITFFNMELFSSKTQAPLPVYLTGTRINSVDTVISREYYLDHKSRNMVLTFAALSYRQNSGIEYRYNLAGSDTAWVYLAGREIQFNPVPFGRHTLVVQARRRGEKWQEQNGITLAIYCATPFWKTTWFWMLAFLLTALLIFLYFARRTRNIKQREKEKTLLNKRVADMEMKTLRAQMNPHFIFNVLNSIQYYITHEDSDSAQYYMSKFAKLVRQTLDNSRSTFISLADELSLLRLYIDLERIRFEDRFEYEIRIENDIPVNAIKIPNMLLQPYVENSIKHGFRDKEVKYFLEITISSENGNIVCIIEDNGIGRDQAALVSGPGKEGHTSTGTAIINEKIEALRYYYKYELVSRTVDVKDSEGKIIGTRVTLVFPEKFEMV